MSVVDSEWWDDGEGNSVDQAHDLRDICRDHLERTLEKLEEIDRAVELTCSDS